MNGNENRKIISDAFVESALFGTFSKIFKANVNTGEFMVCKNDGLLDDELENTPDIFAYIQQLLTKGIVYPEYVTAFRRFANPEYIRKSVFSGIRRIVQSYRRRTSKGDKWITLAIIATHETSPENPWVLYTWREADSDAITLLDTLPTISSLYDKLIRINLTNNTYEPVIVDTDEQERLVGGVINMYEWWADYSKDGNIASDDTGSFGTLTRSGSLQKRFAEDPSPVNFRYRRKVGDEFRWVQLQISPSVEYSEDNQIMLLSLKDIHEEYTAQLQSRQELIDNMNTDALTGLYNRLKFNDDIDNFAKTDDPVFTCMYADVNGLHEMNNTLGHQKGDDMLCFVADTLRKYFPDERVYRIGGDEFVVLSTSLSKYHAGFAMEKARIELRDEHYEISVGIESGSCGENVEKIVADAELAMRNDKAAYYMSHGDRRRERKANTDLDKMMAEKRDNERFLKIITGQFTGVYFVNPENDTPRGLSVPPFFAELLNEADNHFNQAMRLFAARFVKEEYRSLFDDVLDYDKLSDKLKEDGSVQFSFEKENAEKTGSVRMNLKVIEVEGQKDSGPETLWMFSEEKN